MTWKRTIELLRRSLCGPRDTPSEATPVGLPTGPILRETDGPNEPWPISLVIGDHRCIGRGTELEISGPYDSKIMTPTQWLSCVRPKSPWLEGPPKLLFRQYAIEHIFDNKSLPRGDAADRIDVRTFAGTLQCIDMHGWYYFSEPLSRLAPIIVRGNDITRHFLVPDCDGK